MECQRKSMIDREIR